MNYGSVLDANYAKFSDDEKLNYGLKIALSRLQTELNRAWYQEPKDFAPKGPESIYKNKLPSYADIEGYYLIDPFCTVNGSANTSVITDVTVGDILNNSSNASGWGFGDTNGSKDFYDVNTSGSKSVRNNSTNITNTSIAQQGLSYRMFTRYRYWENGLTGKNSNTDGTAGSSSGGTNTNKTEPENAILSYVGNNLSSTRTWKAYDDNLGKENSEDQFFTKLTTYSSPIKIIHPDNVNTSNYTDITKAHPFLEIYIQVPTVSTRQNADTANTSGSGNNANGTDNIGFFNPILRQSLGDVEGYKYVIRGWAGSIAKWGDLTIETGATNNTNILYFLNNPGFILCYGVKDIVNGLNLSYKYPPLISFLRYTGETFSDGIISQGDTLPAPEVSNDKDLFINTTNNTIHRLEDNNGTKTWVGIGGGGGGGGNGDMEINGQLKIKNDAALSDPEYSFSIVNSNNDYRFLTTLIGGNSQLYMYDAAGNIQIAITSDYNSFFNAGTVGIGTDDPNSDAKLDIGGNGSDIYFSNRTNITRQYNADYDTYFTSYANSIIRYADADVGHTLTPAQPSLNKTHEIEFGYDMNANAKFWYSSDNKYYPTKHAMHFKLAGVGWNPTLQTKMTIISNGNVGIGTTNPSSKLNVWGNLKLNYDASNYLDLSATSQVAQIISSTNRLNLGGTVKIGRNTSMLPPASSGFDGKYAAYFSNGNNQICNIKVFYTDAGQGIEVGAWRDNGTIMSTSKPLLIGGNSGYQLELYTTGAKITGNLDVTGTVTANNQLLTGGGGGLTAKIDEAVKIGRNTSMQPPSSASNNHFAAYFSNGLNTECHVGIYYKNDGGSQYEQYLLLAASHDTGACIYYGKPLWLGGNGDVQMILSSDGVQIGESHQPKNLDVIGNLKVSKSVKIGRDTTMEPPPDTLYGRDNEIAAAFSNGGNTSIRVYNTSSRYVNLAMYSTYAELQSNTHYPLYLGGDGANQIVMSKDLIEARKSIKVSGNLTVSSYAKIGSNEDIDIPSQNYACIFGNKIGSDTDTYLRIHNSSSKHLDLGAYSGFGFMVSRGNILKLGGDNAYQMELGSSNTKIIGKMLVEGSGNQEPLATIKSSGDCSLKIEGSGGEVYLEIANTASSGSSSNSWGIGTNDDDKLHLAYGKNASMNKNDAIVINSSLNVHCSGYVGIGIASPKVPLHVDRAVYVSTSDANSYWNFSRADGSGFTVQDRWWDSGGGGGADFGQGRIFDLNKPGYHSYPINNSTISTMLKDNVWIYNGALLVSSDKRIKENIIDISRNIALKKLRKINCYSYEYKDKVLRGYSDTIGFIAQQVNYEFPISCTISSEFIPDVFQKIAPINWEKTEKGQYKLYCDIKDSSSNILDVSGVKYKFIVTNDTINDISNTNLNITQEEFSIIGNSDNSFTFNDKYNNVFCYGKEVDDFHTLDKQKIFTLNVAATKDIDRIQQQQLIDISQNTISTQLNKTEIDLLKLKNEELKQENQELKTDLNIIKLQNQTLQDRLEAIEKRLYDANIN